MQDKKTGSDQVKIKKILSKLLAGSEADHISLTLTLITYGLLFDHYKTFELEPLSVMIRKAGLDSNLLFKGIGKRRFDLDRKTIDQIKEDALFKRFLDVNLEVSDLIWTHLYALSDEMRKQGGIYYTPEKLAQAIVPEIRSSHPKILDPACGCGSLLYACYNMLRNKGMSTEEAISCLSGCDTDPAAVFSVRLMFTLLGGKLKPSQIRFGDALADAKPSRYDLIIMNPPYLGHKLSKRYRTTLSNDYDCVFQDKGDIAFCFFPMAKAHLKKNGQIVSLTSRYLLESENAVALRQYLTENFQIKRLTDFYGLRLAEWPGVDLVVMELCSGSESIPVSILRGLPDERFRSSEEIAGAIQKAKEGISQNLFETFDLTQKELAESEAWRLISEDERTLLRKMDLLCEGGPSLSEIVQSFQGIITGYDEAFIHSKSVLNTVFPQTIIKPWIKGRHLNEINTKLPETCLLYLTKASELSPEQESFLEPYRERLERRRECCKGILPWYSLQWARDPKLFDEKKILYPYKASASSFQIDTSGAYFSADIYGLSIRDTEWDEELLCAVLNSPFYDRCFKLGAKKLGMKLYEYYPNKILKLKLPPVRKLKAMIEKIVNEGMFYQGNLYKSYKPLYKYDKIKSCKNFSQIVAAAIHALTDELERDKDAAGFIHTELSEPDQPESALICPDASGDA